MLKEIKLEDYQAWVDGCNPDTSREDWENIFNNIKNEEAHKRTYSFWFELDGKKSGFLQVFGVMRHPFQSGYIEVLIFEKYRKKGIGKKAILALEKFVFEELKLKKLVAPIESSNTASIALFSSLDYEKTHTDPYSFFLGGKPKSHEIFVKLSSDI